MTDLIAILRDNWLLLLVGQYPNGPLGGLACTLILSVLGIVLAFPASVLVALARLSKWRLLNWPATALVYGARGIPLLLIILWVYFLVPVLIGRNVTGFTTMVVTLVIYESAFLAEVVRAGILALPKGQMEAARALGHSYLGAMWSVILPQAIRNAIPALVNHSVSLFKNSSLAMAIGVAELTHAVKEIESQSFRAFEAYSVATVLYLVFSLVIMAIGAGVARRYRIAGAR